MELLQRQRLVQEQRLSPEQVQYYELLQKSVLELQTAIEEEMRTNPALEIEEDRRCSTCGEILELGEGCSTCHPSKADKVDRPEVINEGTLDYLDDLFTDSGGAYEASYYEKPEEDEEARDKFARAIRKYSLNDHLKAGLPYLSSDLSRDEREVAENIIDMLDENGFIPQDDETLSTELDIPVDKVAKLRSAISDIEPVGAGLKGPVECLLKQLQLISEQQKRDVEIESKIVQHYLKEAAKEQFAKIAKKLGVSSKSVRAAFDFIKQNLYYCPTSQLDMEGTIVRGENIYIEPDVRIYLDGDNLLIEMLEMGLPQLKVSTFYIEAYRKMKGGGASQFSRDERKHIREHLYKAKKFIEHIHTRRDTILRIVEWLVAFQSDYIKHGAALLKPLTREHLANEVGFHPSTVTRALRSRYVQFPDNSVKPFSVFFDSSLSVIAEIKCILAGETPDHVFSDEEITEILGKSGVKLSRRAITKYRHLAKIPSSGKRKRALITTAKEAPQSQIQPDSE